MKDRRDAAAPLPEIVDEIERGAPNLRRLKIALGVLVGLVASGIAAGVTLQKTSDAYVKVEDQRKIDEKLRQRIGAVETDSAVFKATVEHLHEDIWDVRQDMRERDQGRHLEPLSEPRELPWPAPSESP